MQFSGAVYQPTTIGYNPEEAWKLKHFQSFHNRSRFKSVSNFVLLICGSLLILVGVTLVVVGILHSIKESSVKFQLENNTQSSQNVLAESNTTARNTTKYDNEIFRENINYGALIGIGIFFLFIGAIAVFIFLHMKNRANSWCNYSNKFYNFSKHLHESQSITVSNAGSVDASHLVGEPEKREECHKLMDGDKIENNLEDDTEHILNSTTRVILKPLETK